MQTYGETPIFRRFLREVINYNPETRKQQDVARQVCLDLGPEVLDDEDFGRTLVLLQEGPSEVTYNFDCMARCHSPDVDEPVNASETEVPQVYYDDDDDMPGLESV